MGAFARKPVAGMWNGASYRETHDKYATNISPTDPKVKTTRGEFWELA